MAKTATAGSHKLTERSRSFLRGVHPDLVAVVERASLECEFRVTEGVRTRARQEKLLKDGRSQTLNSRHLYGLAVDLCDPDGRYDVEDMEDIAEKMKRAAAFLGVPIVWGGDWKTLVDTPHFELDRKTYPDSGASLVRVARPVDVAAAKGAAAGGTAGTATGVAVTVATPAIIEQLPSIPVPPDLSWLTQWTSVGEQVSQAMGWVSSHPIAAVMCVGWATLMWWLPRITALVARIRGIAA